jgi:hypothetical protein
MRVGYKLYREIRDFAPPDWTSGERLVALMIADDAGETSRRSWLALGELCFRTGLKPSSVRAALAKLAARGYEMRVPHGTGSDGRAVFAAKGHAVDYLVPALPVAASAVAPKPVDNPPHSRQPSSAYTEPKALGNEPKGARKTPKGASAVAPLSSKEPQYNTSETTAVNGSVTEPAGEKLSTGRPSQLETAAWHAAQSRRTQETA